MCPEDNSVAFVGPPGADGDVALLATTPGAEDGPVTLCANTAEDGTTFAVQDGETRGIGGDPTTLGVQGGILVTADPITLPVKDSGLAPNVQGDDCLADIESGAFTVVLGVGDCIDPRGNEADPSICCGVGELITLGVIGRLTPREHTTWGGMTTAPGGAEYVLASGRGAPGQIG